MVNLSTLTALAASAPTAGASTASVTTPIPVWFEIGSMIVLVAILLIDLIVIGRRPHMPSMKEAGIWVGVYVALALVFFGCMWAAAGQTDALQFLAGWITEYSLSIDNLFVFIIIMTSFAVPRELQQEALMIGIVIALIARGLFILAGAVLIERFVWVFYIFGAFLLWTAIKQVMDHSDDEEDQPGLVKRLTSKLNFADHYDGSKLRTTVNGKRMWTPMAAVILALGVTDVMFALDSIPAIYGITQSPFIVFTANVFALMGLRQLYFLLGGLLDRVIYLTHGIAAILAFIGIKLILHALHENELPFINGGKPVPVPEITTEFSLIFIVLALLIAVVWSFVSPKGREVAHWAAARAAAEKRIEVRRKAAEAEAKGADASAKTGQKKPGKRKPNAS